MNVRTIDWDDAENTIVMIDQTLLPVEYKLVGCRTIGSLCEAIKSLRVRGAPALGAAGGFGIALAAHTSSKKNLNEFMRDIEAAGDAIKQTRPTAINLAWGVDRVISAIRSAKDVREAREIALREAKDIADEDVRTNMELGRHGAALLDDGDTVLTHCNAGRLACVDWGTALGVIRSAIGMGKRIKVIACETRPLFQGSRITAWELMEDGIDVTLITDSMSGVVMRQGMVDKVIVGADRITTDAVINKIGTYTHSVLAKKHGIPFYVAAPMSTFDLGHSEGQVEIEQRSPDELRFFGGRQIAPAGIKVYNPAFDATPLDNVSAIVTEKGVLQKPYAIDKIK